MVSDDWELSCNRYAEPRTDYFKRLTRVHEWIFDLFMSEGPVADKLREQALPLLAAQPDRIPDPATLRNGQCLASSSSNARDCGDQKSVGRWVRLALYYVLSLPPK